MLHAHHTQLHFLELYGRHCPTSSFLLPEGFLIVGHKEISIDIRIFIRRNLRGGGGFGSISWSVLKLTTTILFEVVNQVSSLLAFSSRKLCGATWSYGTTVPATWRGHTV
jgi:hypothetical protein